MELRRGQDRDIGMPRGYGIVAQTNQESSSNLSTASIATTVTERRRNETGRGRTVLNPPQTLDHHHLHQQLNLQQQQQQQLQQLHQTHAPERDSSPDPDPAPVAPLPSTTIGNNASNSETPPPPPPPPQETTLATNNAAAASIRYRECLKNHAASMGHHVVDGCGEFMPSGEEGTPEALKCAACDCHRNFHRQEVEGVSQSGANSYYHYNPNRNSSHINPTHLPQVPPSLLPQPPQHHHSYFHQAISPVMMAFGRGSRAPAESSSEDLNMFHSNAGIPAVLAQPPFSPSKKRFRTKFTQDQKDRMQEFAERLGWKIQKQDEQEVQQFCVEVGVKRRVFKVWMHNNKAMKSKQL